MSFSSHSFPHLPLETQAAILRYCDPSTLAVSSRVCLAWLELAGPILYEHITVRGQEQLEMMIRSEIVLASVAPFVSLGQTRTFTYVPLEMDEPDESILDDSYDVSRMIVADPVPVEQLLVDLRNVYPETVRDVHLDALLASFNPTHFHLSARPTSTSRGSLCFVFPSDLAWSHLRRVTFDYAIAGMALFQVAAVADRSPRVDLVYDLTSHVTKKGVAGTLKCILDDLTPGRAARDGPVCGRVQVRVHDNDEVELAKSKLVDCSCTSLDIGVKKPTDA